MRRRYITIGSTTGMKPSEFLARHNLVVKCKGGVTKIGKRRVSNMPKVALDRGLDELKAMLVVEKALLARKMATIKPLQDKIANLEKSIADKEKAIVK